MNAGIPPRPAAPLDWLACVRRGIDPIERHLEREVALADGERAAGRSRWHFERLFKALAAGLAAGFRPPQRGELPASARMTPHDQLPPRDPDKTFPKACKGAC